MYENRINFYNYNTYINNHNNYKYDKKQKKVTNEHLISILLELKIEGLNNVLNNEKYYDSLKKFLSKYKMLGCQNTFSYGMIRSDCEFDEGILEGLICNYDKIYPKVENNETLTSIIDYSNCFSVYSKVYQTLFGKEDFRLISSNSGKNKASMIKSKRISKNVKLINDMYNCDKLSFEPLNETFDLSDNKSIEVCIGNSTNMINLTYGERTESCMRQGGAFNDLFEFCIQNPNGFHVRFTNPENDKLISRVSGIINGNTIFLNELRESVDENYSNDEVYDALKLAMNKVVENSKNSNCPIDNVLISTDYALQNHLNESKNTNLTVKEAAEALYFINFNLSTDGIIIKQKNNPIKYKFYERPAVYNKLRDKTKKYKGQNAVDRMKQLHMINDLLNGKDISKIDVDSNYPTPNLLISGEDYYIALDEIKSDVFILDKSKNNIKTLLEISNILKNIEQKK